LAATLIGVALVTDDLDRDARLAKIMRPFAAATALLTDPDGRVLLLEQFERAWWSQPGGIVDPGETPEQAAERELTEETGIRLPMKRLSGVSWITSGGKLPHVHFHFDAGTVPSDVTLALQPSEVRSSAFVAPSKLEHYMGWLRAERVRALLRARLTGQIIYQQHQRADWETSDRDHANRQGCR
jgi:8-oxo-dGTP pyrophosphatase MutT (NUDIX family)